MRYDFSAFLKRDRLERSSYGNFINNQNLYFFHSKRDKLLTNKPGGNRSLYFKYKDFIYNLSPNIIWKELEFLETPTNFLKFKKFSLKLISNLYTASENKFYSIDNQFAKEKPTGLLVFRGSSLKGALRRAAIDNLESKLIEKNYGDKLSKYSDKKEEDIIKEETQGEVDRFFFNDRTQLVKLFGNERDIRWFTFKTLLATGGIKDVSKMADILERISRAFEKYLINKKIVNSEGVCRGRLIFPNLYFKKVALDVITPLKRDKRTPALGPIHYEVIPSGEELQGTIIWFPFDLIANGQFEKIEKAWKKDKEIIKNAFEKLQKIGIGAKTKSGWGRFKVSWEEE